jgi:hypothetical protein
MGTYYKAPSTFCDLCGRGFNVLIPRDVRGASTQQSRYEALMVMQQHTASHSVPLADIYPKGTQHCITCSALVADRDIGSHFQWHNKKGK